MTKYMFGIVFSLVLYWFIPTAYAGDIERVSVSSTGVQGNNSSGLESPSISPDGQPSVSADGRFVAFNSEASNLVPGDTNNVSDIFVHDRNTGVIERVSVSSTGVQGNRVSYTPSISADGRFVAFESSANNLVTGDTNQVYDIFVHDRDTGITERVGVSPGTAPGRVASGSSYDPSISADGRFVAFVSYSKIRLLDPNDKHDIFVHDRDTGITERVSVSSTGVQPNDFSNDPSISADGRFVAFRSDADNLVAGDSNGHRDIFLHDRATGTTERVSVSSTGEQGNRSSIRPSISADGRFVAFESNANNLVAGDTNRTYDVFVHDRVTQVTERVSVSSTGDGGNNRSYIPSISTDGRFVSFTSRASNLVMGDSNGQDDVFVHNRATGITAQLSTSSAGNQGNRYSFYPSISADSRYVAFSSEASNLVTDDTNSKRDIFVSENILLNQADDLMVSLRSTSGATQVGEYIRFRARLKNNSDTILTNCKALLVNPLINYRREFSYSSWPLKVANPVKNGSIDIAPGETGQFNLAVLPRVAMHREVSFNYICDNTRAFTVPFINTVHLTAKTEPLIAEDFVQLKNSNNRTQLVIDRSTGKYWTGYAAKVSNTGSEATRVNLTTTSNFSDIILRQSQLCEPVDPVNNDWTCISPRDTQLLVELEAGETKKILVYVHARQPIDKKPVANRIYLEAHDGAGEIVAKTSMGISTTN